MNYRDMSTGALREMLVKYAELCVRYSNSVDEIATELLRRAEGGVNAPAEVQALLSRARQASRAN